MQLTNFYELCTIKNSFEVRCEYGTLHYVYMYISQNFHVYIYYITYLVPADTSSGQSQQAADLMQALNQMGVGWLSALSNETGNSGLFYISVLPL